MTLAENHSSTMGAKVKPTLLVPKRWNANRMTRMAHVTPTMVSAPHQHPNQYLEQLGMGPANCTSSGMKSQM